ncbi:MAG TPA: SgcJ/EcaC family oxidoreductase [Candidatus Binatia bacterium]|jgi:uncharacterized protein (TIGR02246 family)
MLPRLALATILVAASATLARADANAEGRAVSEAFEKACNSGDVAAVMELYEDDATAIWPGEGEIAKGKPGIHKLVADLCKASAKATNKLVSQQSIAVGKDHILNVGRWTATGPGPDGKPSTVEIRTTELLHKSGGKWRYVVDHASIGLPPPPPTAKK